MRLLSLSLISSLFLFGCGGSNSSDLTDNPSQIAQKCSAESVNQHWYATLQNDYLWLDELKTPSLDFANYSNTNHLLSDVKSTRDRFSFAIPTDEWNNTIAGDAFGFGIEPGPVGNQLVVYQVFKDSTAYEAGLRRGDIITDINNTSGTTIASWLTEPYNYDAYFNLLGPNTNGYALTFTWLTPDGETKQAELKKSKINVNTITYQTVFNNNAGKVGYLSFQSGFFSSSVAEIDNAFSYFHNENPDTFILDMRYNGGGLLTVASRLALYLGGDKLIDKPFLNVTHNANLADWDQSYSFRELLDEQTGANYQTILNNSLNIDTLIVLTSKNTASASESVINGLAPYLEVILVGEDTYGKPVGFYSDDGSGQGFDVCNETLLAINFQTENALGFADYLNGLTVDCRVNNDTPKADWGDTRDPALSSALYYTEYNNCPSNFAAKGVKPLSIDKRVKQIDLPGMIMNKNTSYF